MADDIEEENNRHMKKLPYLIIASNVIYCVIRMYVFYSSFTWKHWMGLILTSLTYIFSWLCFIALYNTRAYKICRYFYNAIYITCFVQLSSIISGKFWYFYLVIPGFLPYKFFRFVIWLILLEREERRAERESWRRRIR